MISVCPEHLMAAHEDRLRMGRGRIVPAQVCLDAPCQVCGTPDRFRVLREPLMSDRVLDALVANPRVLWEVSEELRRQTRENILRVAGPWERSDVSDVVRDVAGEVDFASLREAFGKALARRCVGGRVVAAVFPRAWTDGRWVWRVFPGTYALRARPSGSTRGLGQAGLSAQQEADHQLMLFEWELL